MVDIVLLYPELLGTYGDRGNALVMRRRAQLRDIDARVIEVNVGDDVPASGDVYLLGGGEDAPQLTALDMLRESGALTAAVERGAVLLAVCAGFQIAGTELPGRDGRPIRGLGLIDGSTTRAAERLVGELAVPGDELGTEWLVGFENHQGVTTPGAGARPIGRRVPERGFATEGAVQGRVVGTYLHGPVLARNPALADRLLERVVGPLAPVTDVQAEALHRERLAAIRHPTRGRTSRRRAPSQ
jgi:lipid II isoglutaminyl synthase (glutamine-hydrolysing)